MPVGKKAIHDLLSPKIAIKRKYRREFAQAAALERQKALKEGKADPSIPPKVNNLQVNKPLFGPHKIKKQEVKVVSRKLSPKEGKSTVNAKSADHLVHKPGSGKAVMDPALGAIELSKTKSKGRRRKKDEPKQSSEKNINQRVSTPEI